MRTNYSGWTRAANLVEVDQAGKIDLELVNEERDGNCAVRLCGRAFDASKLPFLMDVPQVNVKVYSGRTSWQDNMLDCEIFEEDLAIAQ